MDTAFWYVFFLVAMPSAAELPVGARCFVHEGPRRSGEGIEEEEQGILSTEQTSSGHVLFSTVLQSYSNSVTWITA